VRSLGKGVMSATTQVKVLSPEIPLVAMGQGFHILEASIGASAKGEFTPASRGLSPWRANEQTILELGRAAMLRKESAKKPRRRCGGDGMAAVGPIHIRGVMRAMPHEDANPLEGIGSLTLGREIVNAIH